jgi:2,3,4,5-tetrahydropyridine-2,6-dicarboxylate N-succinyltransferase
MKLKEKILKLWDTAIFSEADRAIFEEFKAGLNNGSIRAAEKSGSEWKVNLWVKQGILIGFKMGKLIEMPLSEHKSFFDKDTYPERKFTLQDRVRIVAGGSSIREGAYVAPTVITMPPMYINVGAYVDEGTMVDSHALIGSCAQVGKNVHISAAAQIGGVIEPIGANPVIIEDNVFIGGNCGIYEGVIIRSGAVLAAGVILTASIPVYDSVNRQFLRKDPDKPLIIPENSVIVSGTRPLKNDTDFSIYCPIIIKYRDKKSDASLTFEDLVR